MTYTLNITFHVPSGSVVALGRYIKDIFIPEGTKKGFRNVSFFKVLPHDSSDGGKDVSLALMWTVESDDADTSRALALDAADEIRRNVDARMLFFVTVLIPICSYEKQ